MIWTLICAGGLAVTVAGCVLVELAWLGKVPLEERTGKVLAGLGTAVCVIAVLASPN